VHLKSVLIRGVASLERYNLLVFYSLSASELWPDKRGVASLERDNLLVFYYLSTSELWPDKRGSLS
jgi:hypothetical protein